MDTFLQSMSAGLGNGATYAMLAVGFVVIFKSTGVINFAQPALMVAGSVAVSIFAVTMEMPFALAVVLGIAIAIGVGLLAERVAMRPMVGKPVFAAAIVTLGVDVFIRTVVNRIIGPTGKAIGDPMGLSNFSLGGATVFYRDVIALGVSLVLVAALFAFFKYTRIGLAMRAAAFDQEVALAQGINVGTVFALSWGIAAGLAAIAGIFIHSEAGVNQTTFTVAFKALPAIILGGLDSIGGAVIGGFAVGIVESLFATYQGSGAGQGWAFLGNNFSVISPYVIMLLVLLVKPYGLFGTPEIERV